MFRFLICPVLSFEPIGEIDVSGVQFTESVDGTGTSFSGNAYLSDTQDADKLKSLLNYPNDPKAVALYVKHDDRYVWGGPLQSRPWDRSSRSFQITASSWKSWLYQRFLPPDIANNPVRDIKYTWAATDQFVIADALIGYATAGNGTPTITASGLTSGVTRDLTIYGSEFVKIGEAIDRMASRERGFEWDIILKTSSNGNPNLQFMPYYPKRVNVNSGVLFKSTPNGGNILDSSNPEDTAETIITRVWGTGSGTAGADLLMAYDEDPNLSNDNILLVETKEYSNSTTTITGTISSHVQGIRKFHATGLQQIEVEVSLDSPDWTTYNIGDKVRLIVEDDVLDIDFDAVRIVRREFNVNAPGDTPDFDKIKVLIDLNDTQLPEDEASI